MTKEMIYKKKKKKGIKVNLLKALYGTFMFVKFLSSMKICDGTRYFSRFLLVARCV